MARPRRQVVSLGPPAGSSSARPRDGPLRARPAHRAAGPQERRAGRRQLGEALAAAAAGLQTAQDAGGPGAIGVIGGARLSNEDAYAWAKLAKGVIGTDSVDAQLGDGLPAEVVLGLPRATIDEAACAAPVLVVLAGDLREELPVLFLRLREAVAGRHDPGRAGPDPDRRSTAIGHCVVGASARARPRWSPGALPATPRPTALGGASRRVVRSTATRWRAPGRLAGTPAARASCRGPRAGRRWPRRASSVAEAAARPGRRRCPGAVPPGAAAGQRASAPSTWAWRPGCSRAGSSLEAGRAWFAAAWGAVPEAAGRDTAGILASMAGGAIGGRRGRQRAPTGHVAHPGGGRPAGRLPRRAAGRGGAVGRPTSWWRWPAIPRRRSTPGRRGAALRHRPRAAGDDDQHRGPGHPAGPEAGRARVRLAGLDDRRRAGRRPRGRPGRRAAPTTWATRSSWPPGLLRPHPGRAPRRRGARRDPGADRAGGAPSPHDVGPDRPHGPARCRVGGAPGRAAPERCRPAATAPSSARIAALGAPPALLSRPCRQSERDGATCPGRQLRACGWWPPGVSTTPGAR